MGGMNWRGVSSKQANIQWSTLGSLLFILLLLCRAWHNSDWCPQWSRQTQIICICPDICAFSILDNRHLSDICAICQKCQFEVRKGWQVLLLQSKAEDMHCKQADSAILKLLLVQGSMGQIYFITKQTYVVITCFCRNMGYVAFTRILSRIAFCHEYALFWFSFVQTFTQTFRIWLRFCADIWTKNWRLRPLIRPLGCFMFFPTWPFGQRKTFK